MSELTDRLALERTIKPLKVEIARLKADPRLPVLKQAVIDAKRRVMAAQSAFNATRTKELETLAEYQELFRNGGIDQDVFASCKRSFSMAATVHPPELRQAIESKTLAMIALNEVRNKIQGKLLDANARMTAARAAKELTKEERFAAMKENREPMRGYIYPT